MTPRVCAAAARARPAKTNAPTVAAARRDLANDFRAAGIESPELDARILLGHALGLDHAALAASAARILTLQERDAVADLARRRLAREPLARILGRKEFWSLTLTVDAATLVPRPETETVVEAALAAIDADGLRSCALRIADLGTGCGALILALLTELPNAFGVGTDISLGALRIARDNARRLGLTSAELLACDMAAAIKGPFDLIVSNPPYIASADIAALAPEVRDFDPRPALDGGPDGLDCYRAIAAAAPALLAPGGILVVELGFGQGPAVAALFSAVGLAPSPPRPDLHGVARALLARKAAANRA
ncbi:MAG TPA: peptide chain release factor N(5)-glutamine methyltransferase [Xanthobacteraceae bacterium]|nr:peptide chain release factor N(5)-glutamine methyltransferase [Xanthobacteraceae bacterium]